MNEQQNMANERKAEQINANMTQKSVKQNRIQAKETLRDQRISSFGVGYCI